MQYYSPLPVCSPNLEETLTPMARVPFGKTEEDDLRRNKKTELKRGEVWDASAKCFAFNCGKAYCISEQRRGEKRSKEDALTKCSIGEHEY